MLAVLALLIAQAGAGLHALEHFGMHDDPAGLPGHHIQLCLECASFAPLTSAHGGTATALAVAALCAGALFRFFDAATAARHPHVPFRSRAPPR